MTPTPDASSLPSLAAALAERLNTVAPAGFTVTAEDTDVVVWHHGQRVGASGAVAILETVEGIHRPREAIETAARQVLSGVQDYIADTSAEPWPGRGGDQPQPAATLAGDVVEMWFGDEDSPFLRLEPIRLDAGDHG